MTVLKRRLQHLKPGQIDLLIIDICVVITEIILLAVFLRKIPGLNQRFQINIIGISCKSGKRLIGRIPIARGTKRQNLPIGLPRFF